jgi:hypothetical protein
VNVKALNAWGSIAGGSLVVAGAVLPWLTLDAGLQRYGGTTGIYGWIVAAAGALAVAAGLWTLRNPARWIVRANGVLGVALTGFVAWLYAGLEALIRRPDAAMLVPRAGPGLFVAFAGALAIAACALGARANLRRRHLSL